MSGESVRAILNGSKTQTRRVVKPQPIIEGASTFGGDVAMGFYYHWKTYKVSNIQHLVRYCPYGQVGDRLWVREIWDLDIAPILNTKDLETIFYKEQTPLEDWQYFEWKSPFFMPRWASRILLEITDIRVERLQEITEKDAIAEGMSLDTPYSEKYNSYRQAFSFLWNTLNLKRGYGWEVNLWVWVIGFKLLKGES